MSIKAITLEQVKKILPRFEGECGRYYVMPKEFFGKTRLQKLLGCVEWPYTLGGSDCGCFAVRYAAEILERFADKFYPEGTGSDIEECGVVVGFCKYTRNCGTVHICLATVIESNGIFVPYFFERATRDFNEIRMSQTEYESIQWIRSMS